MRCNTEKLTLFGERIHFATTPVKRLVGLVGRRTFDGVLLLSPCNDIHTFGMRMNIDVAFLDAQGVVLAVQMCMLPKSRLRCRGACRVLERQACSRPWLKIGDTLGNEVQKQVFSMVYAQAP